MMKLNGYIVALLTSVFICSASSCTKKEKPSIFDQQSGVIDPCDPASDYYEKDGKHYIERDYLKQDGTLNIEKILHDKSPSRSPCDPLKKGIPDLKIPEPH